MWKLSGNYMEIKYGNLRASSKGNCMAQKDEKIKVVSANISRKRKQKRDKST